jgi:23S rRNA (cytidine2498-2'-O)-methyltransferase
MKPPGGGPLHGYVTVLGAEPVLQRELGLPSDRAISGGPRWPALVTTPPLAAPFDPAFALQQLPAATHVQGDSVRALVEAAHRSVGEALEGDPAPFTLHAYVPEPRAYRSLAGRAELLGETFLQHLRERRRKLLRSYLPPSEATALEEVRLLQLALVGRGSLLVSLARPRRLPGGGFDLSRWPGGRAPVAEDRRAPSRAYRKLVEAFACMEDGPAPGQACVDLGGAPGGWAWTALARGASVLAVDRSALQPPAAGHPGLTAIIGDAFSYRPSRPVDWLLCDVICRPERTAQLCETWMSGGWCQRLVATLKLKGRADDAQIPDIRRRLARQGWAYLRLKHLANHHNEVAILARRDPPRRAERSERTPAAPGPAG